jgi:transcriptional regulator with XRE-family HTH domain
MRLLDGRQLTAARALAEMTVAELASAAGVTPRTLHRLEIGGTVPVAAKRRHGHVSQAVQDKITAALALRGIELTPEGETFGAGARWAQPRARRLESS